MDRFLESLKHIDAEHIAVEFQPPTSDLRYTIQYDFPYPGHFKRWEFVPTYLDPERYIIFSDTDDVIFQKELPELTTDIYLAPENVLHEITMWNQAFSKYPMFESLKKEPVYNCGLFIFKVKILYEYIKFLQEFNDGGYKSQNMEQLHFNMFLKLHPEYTRTVDLEILCPLYGNLYQGLVKKEDVWKTKEGKTIVAIHANGDNKNIL